jgi:hypothetical protein
MKSDRYICNETSYPHDSALTKRFVVKFTVERCNEFFVAVPQIFDRVKSVALVPPKKNYKGLRFRSYGYLCLREIILSFNTLHNIINCKFQSRHI